MPKHSEFSIEGKLLIFSAVVHAKNKTAKEAAEELGINPENLRRWIREKEDSKLRDLIKQIFEKHYGRYGSPRVWEELKSLKWLRLSVQAKIYSNICSCV